MDLVASRVPPCHHGHSRQAALLPHEQPMPARSLLVGPTSSAVAWRDLSSRQQHATAHSSSHACDTARRAHRRVRLHAAATPDVQLVPNQVQPDLVLEAAALKHKVHVFGIQHTSSASAIAEYILRTKPAAVVVETAVTPEHGARPGNAITCKDRLVEGPAAFYMRMFCSVASGLAKQAAEHGGDITATALWKQAAGGAYRGEQLVYMAALACGSPLLFGDRPKDITYRRLYTLASAAQLDEGFAHQSAVNYMEMLGRGRPVASLDSACMVERIGMQEREAVMCSVAHGAALGVLPVKASHASLDGDAPCEAGGDCCTGPVVMVVGAAHLPGLEQLWSGGRWQELLGSTDALGSALLASPPLETVPQREAGLRRGLLTALLRMSATREVLADVEQTLGPVPPGQQTAYDAVCEIYGSTRTILSCLDRELLAQVCHGVRDEAGRPTDMWETLAPVRAIRPSHGGPGFSEEMVIFLRSLNFDLD